MSTFYKQILKITNQLILESEGTTSEREQNPNGSFYIEDGICRSTVYAMKVKLNKLPYSPVNAIHATSWNLGIGIKIKHMPQQAKALEHNGELQDQKRLINECPLPIDLQINTYQRE